MVTTCRRLAVLRLSFLTAVFVLSAIPVVPAFAKATDRPGEYERAPVMLDGELLFYVRGIPTYPASERAVEIERQLRAFAADGSVPVDSLRAVEAGDRSNIVAGKHVIVGVFDVDATAEGVERPLFTKVVVSRIREAVTAYRAIREPRALWRGIAFTGIATFALLALLFAVSRLMRGLRRRLEPRVRARLEGLREVSGEAIQAEPVWILVHGTLSTVRAALVVAIVYVYLAFALAVLPWTRALSKHVIKLVLGPIRVIAAATADALPGLIFIVIVVFIMRYVLKVIRAFFDGIGQGRIKRKNFEPEWAAPTYRIIWLFVVAFTIVIIYPQIPQSGTDAFKGVSLLLGVMVSLGSSSIVANIVAGYTMIYRRAIRLGDRVRIDGVEGYVREKGVFVTHVHTIKNEDVIVPNSTMLNATVFNYTAMARTQGLILHARVGIGYETPWRQVEAMLKLAAQRTPGILDEPKPFVLQKLLGDFAVTYEINVYTNDASHMDQLYHKLNQNILDVFNEFGVQIMTPAYVRDPEQPKVVPRDQWFAPPASEREE